jgi:hypothetical protein
VCPFVFTANDPPPPYEPAKPAAEATAPTLPGVAPLPGPPPGYPVAPGGPQPTPINYHGPVTGQPVVHPVIAPHFGATPVQVTCQCCHQFVTTMIDYEYGTITWMMIGLIIIFG